MNVIEELKFLPCMYERLSAEKRPILLYGMGDGAEKIYSVLNKKGIKVQGVFASEGFVRGQSFLGFKVMSFSEAEKKFGDFAAVLCFALEGSKTQILDNIKQKHTLYSPNVPVYGEGIFDKEYILTNIKKIKRLYELFADEISKRLFVSLLKYNITGDISYLFENKNIFSYPQKFFLHTNRHIDVGAYDGDTVLEYADYNKAYSDIIAFEPDKVNCKKLKNNTAQIRDVVCENAAVLDKNGMCGLAGKGNRGAFVNGKEGNTKIISIDSYCNQQTVNAQGTEVGSIKIDAEGADRQVLYGAVNTIYKNCPDIMLALYHRADDILELPLLIKKYDYKYKLFLRKKDYVPAWDVFLLAFQ